MSSQPMPPVVPSEVARKLAEGEPTDSDGTPVGEADHREDIRRAGGDPDEVEETS